MLSETEIKRFIDDDITSEKKRLAHVGQRYYDADHDIKYKRLFYYNTDGKLVEDTTRSNIKISHPFFKELADQLSAYMLSFTDNPIRAIESAEGLQNELDLYFDDEFWSEIDDLITGCYVKGFDYIYAYKNAENRLSFACADGMGVVEVRERDTDDGCRYIIYWYVDRIDKGRKEIKRIQVWSDRETWYYVQAGNGKIELDKSERDNPRPHVVYTDEKTGDRMGYPLGFIPFWRLDFCKKQFSGLKPIKGHIDDYDIHACSLSNNLIDFDTPLYVVSGFQGDNLEELQQNLKTKKIVGVDSEGGIKTETVEIPYQARKEKLEIDEKNIYRFGMGINTAQVGDGNITNIVIQSRYALLDMKSKKLIKRLKKLLRDILDVVLAEINAENGTDYNQNDIYFDFTPTIATNETENTSNELVKAQTRQLEINTILNVSANVGDEQTLRAICDVMEWDYQELSSHLERMQEDTKTAQERTILNGVIPDEKNKTGIDSGDQSADPFSG